MGLNHSLSKRILGFAMAALFTFEVTALHAAEASLWAERRRAVTAARPDLRTKSSDKSTDQPKPSDGETLLAALPAVRGGLSTVQQPSADSLTAALFKKDGAPAWVQVAVTKYATVNSVRLTGRSESPTVFLMQDAHLHVEAQSNIAGAVEALAADIAKRGDSLLVALEGAPAGDIDFADYAKDDERLRRSVAEALVKSQILSGAEGAAVANAGASGGKPLFTVAGLEEFGLFRENVDALRATSADRTSAHRAIADLRQELTALKKKHFDPDLIRFDGRKDAFETGSLGLPTYALYLDSVTPAQSANLRELIEAALLEGALKFSRVETERRALLGNSSRECPRPK